MNNDVTIVYETKTGRILPWSEVLDLFARKDKSEIIGKYRSIPKNFAKIEDGYIVGRYTAEELKQMEAQKAAVIQGSVAPDVPAQPIAEQPQQEKQGKVIEIPHFMQSYQEERRKPFSDGDPNDLELFVNMVNRRRYVEPEPEIEDIDIEVLGDSADSLSPEELDTKAVRDALVDRILAEAHGYDMDSVVEDINTPEPRPRRRRPRQTFTQQLLADIFKKIEAASVKKEKETQKRDPKKTFKIVAIAAGVSATIIVGGIVGELLETLHDRMEYNDLHRDFGQAITLYLNEGERGGNIINRNSHQIPGKLDIYGKPQFWIDNRDVAQDLLSLPPEVFDGALYHTYAVMGNHRDENWDDVIRALADCATMEANPIIYGKVAGCYNFNEYLIKNGLVDAETLEPSLEKFIEQGESAVALYSAYMGVISDNLQQDPDMGGR